MKTVRRWLCPALLGVALAGVAMAQSEPPKQPLPAQPPPLPALPDPTKPSQRMQDALAVRPTEGVAATAPRIPAVALKGRVIARGRAAALVEVNGQTHTVTPGMSMAVGTQVLTFVEVSAAGVRVEINVPKETLILN